MAYTNKCRAKDRRNCWGSASKTSRKPEAPRKTVPSGSSAKSSILTPVLARPTASKPSNEKPMASILMWQLAQSGLDRWCSICSRKDMPSTCPSAARPSTPGGAGGGGASSKLVNTHFPRLTGLVRVGLLVAINIEACRRKPSDSSGVRTRRKLPDGTDRKP